MARHSSGPLAFRLILTCMLALALATPAPGSAAAVSGELADLAATALAFGETIGGAIDHAGESDAYTFSAQQGDRVLVTVTTSPGGFWPRIRLYAPGSGGVPLLTSEDTTRAEVRGRLPVTGNYTVLVDDGFNGALTGAYSAYLQRLNTPERVTPIGFGETLESAIDPAGEIEAYAVQAYATDTLLVAATASPGSLWPRIRVFDPAGRLMGAAGNPTHTELTVTLGLAHEVFVPMVLAPGAAASGRAPVASSDDVTSRAEPGTYTILVDDAFNGALTGAFSVFVQRLNEPGNVSAAPFGQTLEGAIDPVGEFEGYTFSAREGDTILLAATTSPGNLWPRIRLYGQDGALLGESSASTHAELTQTLSFDGEYTVLINDGFNGALTGAYGLQVQRLNDPGNAVPLLAGDPITGAIAAIGEIDTFVISGDAGDTLIVSASNKSGSPWPELRLYTPSGALLAAGSASTHVEIMPTLPSGGSHTLLVGDGFNGTLVGAYAVQLQSLP